MERFQHPKVYCRRANGFVLELAMLGTDTGTQPIVKSAGLGAHSLILTLHACGVVLTAPASSLDFFAVIKNIFSGAFALFNAHDRANEQSFRSRS